MKPTYALDVYGTLINPLGIGDQLALYVGDKAPYLAELWRSKQLEYSFRRGLMRAYKPFPDVTRAALDFACQTFGETLSEDIKTDLMEKYRTLDAFDDVPDALHDLNINGATLHAFSNGTASDVAALLAHAEIGEQIQSIISVETVKSFKPDPDVYAHFNTVTGSRPETTWLVSSNPFDIIGASSCGWKTAWVQRKPSALFDPWEHGPTKIIKSLTELAAAST
ncbi:haloacid dehalogenase type II [Leisingera sp. SS27]|uniref:haloacid dehalogenase type II n=1 Tax=Leisingera sp. SS27 TaxID=2979462 RepID=UPI00232CA42B|nr:haloacid dehalogenase type II [Leisingera sp. SS27]MDC0660559.1 haloacid dehalogenase type II [Leisingera sp. SS27]